MLRTLFWRGGYSSHWLKWLWRRAPLRPYDSPRVEKRKNGLNWTPSSGCNRFL